MTIKQQKSDEIKNAINKKIHLTIGTIGHVDSGKSTLSSAITKLQSKKGLAKFMGYEQIDKSPEEKLRGITISSTHIEFETEKYHCSNIDAPGHADYIKNMITGASQMDGAILVVSATAGVEEQTEEHLLLAKQIGVKHIVVFMNDKSGKGSKITEEEKELLEMNVRPYLEKYGYDTEVSKTPIIFGSALKVVTDDPKKVSEEERQQEEKNLEKLIQAIEEHIPIPERDENKSFLMYIEDSYAIKGQGTVVTGKVIQGTAKEGDKLELVGFEDKKVLIRKQVVVKGVEMFHKKLEKAIPGGDVGINLRGVERHEVIRGQALGTGLIAASKFKAHVYILSEKERGRKYPFESGYQPQIFLHTADVTGKIIIPENKEAKLGSDIDFEVNLLEPIVMKVGDNFIMREGGKTVGRGVITELLDERKPV